MGRKLWKITIAMILAVSLAAIPVMASEAGSTSGARGLLEGLTGLLGDSSGDSSGSLLGGISQGSEGGGDLMGTITGLLGNLGMDNSGTTVADDGEAHDYGIAEIAAVDSSEYDLVSLDDVGISIRVSGYSLIEEDQDGFVYVETIKEMLYPYVIIGSYDFTSDSMLDSFTEFMREGYPDLQVESMIEGYEINGDSFDRIEYIYKVGDNQIEDTRLFYEYEGVTYMFGSKESKQMNLLLPEGYLESIADSFRILSGKSSDYKLHVNKEQSIKGDGSEWKEPTEDKGSPDKDDKTTPDDDILGEITFDESIADYEGVWVEYADGFRLYLPAYWYAYELSEEEFSDGYYYMAYDPEGLESSPIMEIDWVMADDEDGYDLDTIAAILKDQGKTVDGKILVNDIIVLSFSDKANDFTGFVFLHPETNEILFQIVVYPYSTNYDLLSTILCSLSITQ